MSKLKLDLCPALTTVTFTCSLGSVRLNHCIEASLEALASWWACLPATVQLVRIFVDIGRRTLGGRFGPGGAVPIRALPWATLHKRFAALRKSAPSKTLDIRVIALRGDVEAYTWATDGIAQAHSDWAQGCEEFDRRMEAKAPSFISFVPSAGATFRCGREKADMS